MDLNIKQMKPMTGGNTSEYAIKAFGDMNRQHASSSVDNTIASKHVVSGGKKSKSKSKKGGVYEQILVPVTLIAANTIIKSRKSTMSNKKYKKSGKNFKKYRFTRRRR